MKILSLLGLDARIRRLRIAAGEGALAAADRAHLLKLAWHEEKLRMRQLIGLAIAVMGLTTVTVALVSVAVVVQFWDTPYRATAAWVVALVWLVLWLAAVWALLGIVRQSSKAFDPALHELEKDWAWAKQQLGARKVPTGGDHPDAVDADADADGAAGAQVAPSSRREPTRDELLARIELQRQRVATMQAPDPRPSVPRANEPLSATAMRTAREHPIVTGAVAAAIAAVVGPRRLLRWGAVLAPIFWRMRG